MLRSNRIQSDLLITIYLPWSLSWLDRGALINVDATGFGLSVVRGPTGHK